MSAGLWTERLASRRFRQYAGALPTTCRGKQLLRLVFLSSFFPFLFFFFFFFLVGDPLGIPRRDKIMFFPLVLPVLY
jgi:hypothetical protein